MKHLAAGDLFNVFAIEQGPWASGEPNSGRPGQADACSSDLNDLCLKILTRGLISARNMAKSKAAKRQQQPLARTTWTAAAATT